MIWANSVLTFLGFLTINVLFPLFLSPYPFLCLSFSLLWNTCCLIIQVVSVFSHFFRHQLFPYAHSLLYGFVFSDVVSFVMCVCVCVLTRMGFQPHIILSSAEHYITLHITHYIIVLQWITWTIRPLTSVTLRPRPAQKWNPDADQNNMHKTCPQGAKMKQINFRLQVTNVRNRLSYEQTGLTWKQNSSHCN